MKPEKILVSRDCFEEYLSYFRQFIPVKVSLELKDEFREAINQHFILKRIDEWSADLIPLKESWKFKRTS